MTNSHEMVGSSDRYDGVLSRPFLAEHWYQGFVAAVVSLFIFVLLLCTLVDVSLQVAAFIVAPFSLLLLAASVTQQQRFEIDINLKRYRSCLWVLGLRFGEWQHLPAIESIIIRHRPRKHLLPLEDDYNIYVGIVSTEDKWQVLLRVIDSPVGIVAAYVSQAQATLDAAALGALLQVEVIQ
jgi:hypothetical protein